jgi:hypothetical protein
MAKQKGRAFSLKTYQPFFARFAALRENALLGIGLSY